MDHGMTQNRLLQSHFITGADWSNTGAAEGFAPVVYKPLKGLYKPRLEQPFAGRWTGAIPYLSPMTNKTERRG